MPTLLKSAGNDVIRSRHSPSRDRSNGLAFSDRPPGGPAAGQFRLVVREALGDLEPQIAVRLNEIQHLRAGANERLHQVVVHEPE